MRWLLPLLLAVPLSAQVPDSVRTYQSVHRDSTQLFYTVRRVDTLRLSLPSRLTIPIGPYHAPLSLLGRGLTGTLKYGDTLNWKAQLDSVRGRGSIFFALTTERKAFVSLRNGQPYFDLAKWTALYDRLWGSTGICDYVRDGTIAAIYLMDEPQLADSWGAVLTPSQVDSAAAYVKSKCPFATIAVRVVPQWLDNTPHVDLAWAQYEGPHIPSNGMTAKQFADSNVKAAKARGLGLVLAINSPDGGDGSSRMDGTFAKDLRPKDAAWVPSNKYRYAMSATELLSIGKVFVAEPYACAVSGWMNPQTFARLDIQLAWFTLASIPRAFTPCRRP